MLWWEYPEDNSITQYSSTSCANAGDKLYVETDYNNWYTEVCDDSETNSPCWTSTYSPSNPFTPYYAQFIGEANTVGSTVEQIPEFTYGSSYGMIFFNSAIYDDFNSYFPPGSGYLDTGWYLAQSSSEPEASHTTDDWSSDNIDVVWDNSYISQTYMCSTWSVDC